MSVSRRSFTPVDRGDPTADWSETAATAPEICLDTAAIGGLRFGGLLDDARFLGKADFCRYAKTDYLELIYARAGFQLDFEDDRLAYAVFFVAHGVDQAEVPGLELCCPRERAAGRFSAETKCEDIIAVFGKPDSVDFEEDIEVVLFFSVNGLTLEFEFSWEDSLKRWNLYPIRKISQ